MAIAMKGLRVKPTFEQLVNVAVSGHLYNIQIPIRGATFMRNGFALSQVDGEGMRTMENQQQMRMKEVYTENALRSLASSNSDDFSHASFKSVESQNTRQQIINEMLTRAREATRASTPEYYDISDSKDQGTGSDIDVRTEFITVAYYLDQVSNLQQQSQLEKEELIRMHEFQTQRMTFEANRQLYELEQQLMTSILPPYVFARMNQTPFPTFSELEQHLKSVEDSQKARQQRATSSTDPETLHEPKGPVGRPKQHGTETETRIDPLWWEAQPTGYIRDQLSNMGWREPFFLTL